MAYSFADWLRQRHLRPEGDNILPLLAAAGANGIGRKELGHALHLEPHILDELLASMLAMGMVAVTVQDGVAVYRSPAATVTPTPPR